MTESDIEPNEIYIDKTKNGQARLLCRWNIQQETRTEEETDEEKTFWTYNEKVLWWKFPDIFDNDGTIVQIDSKNRLYEYLNQNKDEIMSFARGATINL